MAGTPRTKRDTYEWTYFEKIDNSFFSCLDVREKIIETSTVSVPDDPFKNLLELLGLSNFFSGKLSLQTTQIKVDEIFSSTSDSDSPKCVPWIILQKLIASDSDFREKTLLEFIKKITSNSRKSSVSSNHSNDSSEGDSSQQSSFKTDEESEEENCKSLQSHDEENKTAYKQGSLDSKVKSTDEKKSETYIKCRVHRVFHSTSHDSYFCNPPEKEESSRKTISTSLSKHETHKTFVSELLIIPVRSRNEENQQIKSEVTNTSDVSESCLYERQHQDSTKDSSHDISEITSLSTFHPMDVLLAIYQCCDFCLRRLLAHKFHNCQYAIPFVYNTFEKRALELSIWPLREIYLWHHYEPAIKMDMPSISFLRFGQHFMCKSKILNSLLCEHSNQHKVFQDDTCAEGKRKISTGMIEIYWCIRKSKDGTDLSKKKSFTVLNMRGDALENDECRKQLELLMMVSNAFVLFVDKNTMEKDETRCFCKRITGKNKEFLIVTEDAVDENQNVFSVDTKKYRSSQKVEKKLIEKIFSLRKSVKKCRSLEKEIFDFQGAEIDIDENRDDCRNGKAKAREVLKLCNLYSKPFSKDELIPLQGKEFWCKWSKLDKERQKKGKDFVDLEEYLRMIEVRKQQINKCNSSNIALAAFVKAMLELQQDDSTLLYFIFWIKQGLDEVSKSQLPNLRRKLEKAIANQNKYPGDSEKVIKLKECIADASFGIEHIFREISQIYEAFASMKEGSLNRKTERVIEKLPCVVAKLSLLGQPLEIMDGDAANVPLCWLKKIFAEITTYTQAELVTSVSVIGVQSSGKSTLLNTMFGIQFPVSAGRCTRGIYAQFIPVSKDHNFGYLMIIDTEGLRAPETAEEKIDFDNEIAALAIGLSDVSIINVLGETVGEMRDILQIVVHAFIRLKKSNQSLDYKQSGIFVHQNVSASDSREKTLEGSFAFMNHLDSMAAIVAIDEQMPKISKFCQVIDLDFKDDKICIPNFLENDASTMPNVAQGYCKAVTAAKRRIFDKLENHVELLCNASDTFWNLRNLWKGIKAETFIFSFRNCQEALASKMLAKKFQELTWSFEEKKHDWWNKNRQKLIVDDLVKVENCASELNKNFSEIMTCEAESAKVAIIDFIEDHKYKTFMKHFEERRLHDLQHYIDNLKRMTFEDINREKRQRLEFLENYDEMITKQSKIKEEARDLAEKNWGSDFGQLLGIFQKWWNVTLDEKCSQYDGFEVIKGRLRSDMEGFLLREHNISIKFVQDVKCTDKVPVLKDSLKAEDIPLEGIRIAGGNDLSTNFPKLVVNVLNLSFEKIEHYFEGLLQKDSRFDELHFKTILRFVIDDIEEHNKKHYTWYSIKESLVNDVIRHVSKKTYPVFLNLNKDYETKYGMRSELSKCRVKAFQIFQDTFHKFVKVRQEEKRKRDEVSELEKRSEQYRKNLGYMENVKIKTEEKTALEQEKYERIKREIIKLRENQQEELENIRQVQQERQKDFENMRLEEESLKHKKTDLSKKLQQLSKERDERNLAMENEQREYEERAKQLREKIAQEEMNMKEIREKRSEEERKMRQKEEMKKIDSVNIESSTDFIVNELHTVLGEKFAEFLRHRMKRFIVNKFEGQKENLMIRVLKELAEQESSDNYKSYISSPETYVLKWLTEYSKAIFFGNSENSRSEFKKCLEEFATQVFSSLKGCATLVTKESKEKSIRKWVEEYKRKLLKEELMISLKSFDDVDYEIQDSDLFLSVLKKKITALEEELNRKQPEKIKWREKTPYEETMNFLWGCAEKCPWCNEPCKSSIPNHADDENFHECLQHRPVGIQGICNVDTKLLVIEPCDFKVQSNHTLKCAKWCGCITTECASSHLYSDYKKYIHLWKIVPCADMSNAKYWTWVVGKFYKDFEEQFGKTFSPIPSSWIELSKTEAVESLDTYKTDEAVKSLKED